MTVYHVCIIIVTTVRPGVRVVVQPSGSRRARRPAPAARIDACRRPSNFATGSLEVEAAAPVAAAAAAAVGEN